MLLLYKDKNHLQNKSQARFTWGVLLFFWVWCFFYFWGWAGGCPCVFVCPPPFFFFFKSGREQAETQNCSFWAKQRSCYCTVQQTCLHLSSQRNAFLHRPHLSSKARISPPCRGTRKLNFLCKALTRNSMTYKSTMMVPIRTGSKLMSVNSRALNWCY